ncbi:response regulator [Paenibacillus agricola]|uniref:histidine kinase n=1 Tax=Paenibacillus agricola TaxID=2716264 RepID=A0ABX0J8X9_9BACL|nr:response regulator [Paenibacillus agricola]NHN30461.1 response regulator [Paenibacillus agricola]
MFKNAKFNIRAKISLGYFIIVVCLGVSIFMLNDRISSMEKEIDFITNHDMEVHNLANQALKHVLNMETGKRGYALTGDLAYLEPYNQALAKWEEDYTKLYELITDNPSQQKKLEEIKANIQLWIHSDGEPTISLKKENKTEDILVLLKTYNGKKITDQLRTQIEAFLKIEKDLTEMRVTALDQKNRDVQYGLYLIILLVIVLSVVVSSIIARSIVRTIKQVSQAISGIASAEGSLTSNRIEVKTRDEIKELGDATNQLLETHEKQNWTQTSIADVASAFQGFNQVSELAQAFINKIAFLLDASYGVFYTVSGNKLEMTAAFAATGDPRGASSIRLGEGLVGQSAVDKRIYMLDKLPEEHMKITTALGDSSPRSIMIFPIEFQGTVLAVVELASLDVFTPIQRQLVEQIRSTVGIAMNSAAAQMEVQRLLEESQSLSEELQAQTEELQQQTEALQAQSMEMMEQQDELKASNDSLKRSEDRLQRQQEELEQSNLELELRSDQLESQMRKIEEINEQVEQQNALLGQQARDLISASQYKSEFLANMSHELRTPLNSLLILSQILEENKEANLTPKQVEFAKTIHSSGSDLLRLIDEILDLSKIEAGQMKIEMEPVFLEDMKESLGRSYRPLAGKKGINFHVILEGALPNTIYTDGHRLQQILKNLLTNAFKFTSKGHVTLRIFRTNSEKSLLPAGSLQTVQDAVIAFSVIDTGIGIPKDKKDIIFEAFQQADGTTSRKYGGTGLGLTISRDLSVLIGGHIEIESEEGAGSTFTLYVPELQEGSYLTALQEIAASDAGLVKVPDEGAIDHVLVPHIELSDPSLLIASEMVDDRDEVKSGDKVLLIIEDDIHFAEILLDIARSRGFKGLVALQGDKGLALAHAYKPDAIMLDIQLPVLDGWYILERLKQHPETRHIPVHIISVNDESRQGLTMGAMAYLIKPVSKENIDNAFSRIESFINRNLKRLLIVEDDIVLRNSLVELIGHDDVAITAVSSGSDALAELQAESFDCMVMDLGLSDISGFDLLDRIRQTEKLKQLPIIIYTGKDLDMKEEMKLKKYAESIIIKNVKSQERLYDETALFLHRVEANLPEERRNLLKKLYSNEAALDGKRILLVEDDMRNIFALSNVLESYNLKVTFAENGREALDLLEQNPEVDLILMDIMMPEMDGYEAMKAIRKMPQFEKIPIIALTAKAMKEDRQRCIDAGASDYISKPIDTERLLSLLKVWLYI